MAPFAFGMLILVASAMTAAVLLGAIAGTITGMRRTELSVGALTAVGLYLLAAPFLGFRLGVASGMLPLILTFLAGSLTARALGNRSGWPWLGRAVAALLCALAVGFLYLLPARLGSWALANPRLSWIAVAALGILVFLTLRRARTAPH